VFLTDGDAGIRAAEMTLDMVALGMVVGIVSIGIRLSRAVIRSGNILRPSAVAALSGIEKLEGAFAISLEATRAFSYRVLRTWNDNAQPEMLGARSLPATLDLGLVLRGAIVDGCFVVDVGDDEWARHSERIVAAGLRFVRLPEGILDALAARNWDGLQSFVGAGPRPSRQRATKGRAPRRPARSS
jgi:hypothetical protein